MPVRYCIKHRKQPALQMCRQCHRPMCERCFVETSQGIFCSRGCARKHARFQKKYARLTKKTKSSRDKWLVRLLIWLVLLTSILVVIHLLKDRYPILRKYDLIGNYL